METKKQSKKQLSAEKKKALKEKIASMTPRQKSRYYLKKALLIAVIVFALLLCLYALLGYLDKKVKDSGSSVTGVTQADEEYPTYPVFPAEWNKNVFEDEEYMNLGTEIIYSDLASGSFYEMDESYITFHEGHRFFKKYFEMLQKGDYEIYPTLFEDKYDAQKNFEKKPDRKFPPQMVYNITVEEAGRFEGENDGRHCVRGVYFVDYKIHRNNNLFRNDIGYINELETDSSRPLVFELITYGAGTKNEETYIHAIYTKSSIEAKAAK